MIEPPLWPIVIAAVAAGAAVTATIHMLWADHIQKCAATKQGVAMINYEAAGEYAQIVRAIAITETEERPLVSGDGGRAYGLLQFHPPTFIRYYLSGPHRFGAEVADTWIVAEIKGCAYYLSMRDYRDASSTEKDLIIQGWNLGERAVFVEGKRNPEYLAKFTVALSKVRSGT